MSEPFKRPLHMVRYGISRESRYFLGDFLDTYDLIVFNGTIAAYYQDSLTALVSARLKNKPFIVDPLTHAFQHSLSSLTSSGSKSIKASVAKVVNCLGDPVKSCVAADRPVRPGDFADDAVLRGFTSRTIEFQMEVLRQPAQDSGDMEYYEFLNVDNALEPAMVTAPYFLMDKAPNAKEWAKVNRDLLDATLDKLPPDRKVLFELVVSQGLLGSDELDDLTDYAGNSRVHGIAVWVDELDETKAPRDVLARYIDLLKRIGRKKPIYILYGSYLPVALAKVKPEFNIAGVCHSLEYGEHRPVAPVGGGLPSSKFYYPSLHSRLVYEDAFRLARDFLLYREAYLGNVCDCPVCVELISSGVTAEQAFAKYGEATPIRIVRGKNEIVRSFPTSRARDLCVRHYLHCKQREFTVPLGIDAVIEQLQEAADMAEMRLGTAAARHCRLWAELIAED